MTDQSNGVIIQKKVKASKNAKLTFFLPGYQHMHPTISGFAALGVAAALNRCGGKKLLGSIFDAQEPDNADCGLREWGDQDNGIQILVDAHHLPAAKKRGFLIFEEK